MERERNKYYDIQKRLLSMLGQWPYQMPREKLFFRIIFFASITSVFITQVAQFCICETGECIIQNLCTHMLAIMFALKLLTYQFNSGKMKQLTDHLFANWDIMETEKEHDIMKEYTANGKWYSVIYIYSCYATAVLFICASLVPQALDLAFPLNESRPIILAYPAYYFVDVTKYFRYIFLHMLIVILVCSTAAIAHDCMFFAYVEHLCGLFAVVGFRFEHTLYRRKSARTCNEGIAFAVRVHEEALQFAVLLENCFSIMLGAQIAIVTTGMSVTLVLFTMRMHNFVEAVKYLVFIFIQLFHLFCFSFLGQKVIDYSVGICDRIYNGAWFAIPTRSQRLLCFAITRGMEARSLTAGKIYTFSLKNFTTILQTAVSYFTVLSSFNEP